MTVIEELEAHLHPHYQLNVLRYLIDNQEGNGQTILTTHSITLGSSIPLGNLIICKNDKVFPMDEEHTNLDEKDYKFLERFLDATKANLFFAKGVIIVEGIAENLIVPAIARQIDLPLHKHGVSIINVGGAHWQNWAGIFSRNDGSDFEMKVAVISDGDIPCNEYLIDHPPKVYWCYCNDKVIIETNKDRFKEKINNCSCLSNPKKEELKEEHIKAYLSFLEENDKKTESTKTFKVYKNDWTLEYSLAQSCLKSSLLVSMKSAEELSGKSVSLPEDESNPYEMMKPFLKGLSKGTTAQYLAEMIDSPDITKEKIEKDEHLKYIVEAIKFACSRNQDKQ